MKIGDKIYLPVYARQLQMERSQKRVSSTYNLLVEQGTTENTCQNLYQNDVSHENVNVLILEIHLFVLKLESSCGRGLDTNLSALSSKKDVSDFPLNCLYTSFLLRKADLRTSFAAI